MSWSKVEQLYEGRHDGDGQPLSNRTEGPLLLRNAAVVRVKSKTKDDDIYVAAKTICLAVRLFCSCLLVGKVYPNINMSVIPEGLRLLASQNVSPQRASRLE